MAKIRSTITGTVNHAMADKRAYRRDIPLGDINVPANSHPLSSMVESASLRSTERYDWQTGTFKREQLDVVDNARRNINTLKIRPVTNARHCDESSCTNSPMYGGMYGGMMAMPASAVGGRNRKKKR